METRTWLFIVLLAAACVPLKATDPEPPASSTESTSADSSSDESSPDAISDATDGATSEGTTEGTTAPTTEEQDTVTKEEFDITGVRKKSFFGRNYLAFCGIPYAEPPIGLRRFKNPIRMEYDGNIDATKCDETPVCVQFHWHKAEEELIGQEDCLYLNVYEPEVNVANMPVLVYFHGGGFFYGSGTFKDAGPDYFMDQDVVLVTINYRLGAFGFFSLNKPDAPGNMGMADQVMALRWVRDNIKYFHGDRFRVTIMGEGAGAASVHLHLFSPMSRGLFSRAISMNGGAFNSWALFTDMVNTSKTHAALNGCNKERDSLTMKCMRELEADEIQNSTKGLHFWVREPLVLYKPMVQDGQRGKNIFLRRDPLDMLMDRDFYNVPWLMGVVKTPGFFHLERYLVNPPKLNYLLDKFLKYGSVMLAMHVSIPDPTIRNKTMDEMMDLYRTEHGEFTRDSLVEMFNDREFNLGQLLAVAYHALLFHEDLYQYRFEYRGQHTMGENCSNVDASDVVNGDELIYLFRRPELLPDFDRSDPEGKRDVQMMRKLTRIWAEFAATGHVRGLHRSKRDTATLATMPTDAEAEELFHSFSRAFSRQRRDEEAHAGEAKELRSWKDFLGDSLHNKSDSLHNKTTCWSKYSSTVWPAVRRFPFTAGNVPLMPYMSFRRGDNDTPVQYCLSYLMEFDRLSVWTQQPLKEVKLPDIFLNFTTTVGTTAEVTTVQETTTVHCPTWPPIVPTVTEEPPPTPPQPVAPPEIPSWPPVVPGPPEPPPPPPPEPIPPVPVPPDVPVPPEPPLPPQPPTWPSVSIPTYTWPQYPKPPEPTEETYPPINVSLPPITTTEKASPHPSYSPSPPTPSVSRETFTWIINTTESSKAPTTERHEEEKAKKPHKETAKQKAPRTCVVWSFSSIVLLLLLVVQF